MTLWKELTVLKFRGGIWDLWNHKYWFIYCLLDTIEYVNTNGDEKLVMAQYVKNIETSFESDMVNTYMGGVTGNLINEMTREN